MSTKARMMDRSGEDGARYLLEHVDIEVNHQCNLSCRHCSARAGRAIPAAGGLSIDDIRAVLHSAVPLGLRKIGLTGGEPLLEAEKLEEIARFCLDELGMPVHMHSNGTLVTEKICGRGHGLSLFESVSVTFLGGDAETHDQLTQTSGSFKRAFEGACRIAAAGLPLTCYFIPMKGNCRGFLALGEALHGKGIRRIRVMKLAPSGRARANYSETMPDANELRSFEDGLSRLGDELSMQIEAGNCTRLSMPGLRILAGHDRCMSGLSRVHVNFRGEVFPCTASSGVDELKLGNLRESGFDLKRVWVGSPLLKRVRCLKEAALSGCERCSRIVKCYDTCMVSIVGTMSSGERRACALFAVSEAHCVAPEARSCASAAD